MAKSYQLTITNLAPSQIVLKSTSASGVRIQENLGIAQPPTDLLISKPSLADTQIRAMAGAQYTFTKNSGPYLQNESVGFVESATTNSTTLDVDEY